MYRFNLKEGEEGKPKMMTIENTTGGMLNDTFPGTIGTNITSYDILTTVLGILAAVSNGLLLIAMVRFRSSIFKSKGAYLIASLAIADFLTGLNSSLWGLRYALQFPQALNKILLSNFWINVGASFLTILVMSLDRYIAIVFPFKAQVWLSKTRTLKCCVVVWLISAMCGACMALSPLIVQFCLTIVFEITILITMFFYCKIIFKLRQRRMIFTFMQPPGARDTHSNVDLQRWEYKLITVELSLMLIFIITVLPYMVAGQIYLVRYRFTVANYDPKLQLFIGYYLPVELMNFVLNPIVYAMRLPKYRLALLRTLHCR